MSFIHKKYIFSHLLCKKPLEVNSRIKGIVVIPYNHIAKKGDIKGKLKGAYLMRLTVAEYDIPSYNILSFQNIIDS